MANKFMASTFASKTGMMHKSDGLLGRLASSYKLMCLDLSYSHTFTTSFPAAFLICEASLSANCYAPMNVPLRPPQTHKKAIALTNSRSQALNLLLGGLSASSRQPLLLLPGGGLSSCHAFPEGGGHLVGPGIHEGGVAQHGHAAPLPVLAEDHDLQLVANVNDGLDIGDAVVADLADMEQALGAANVHKGTVWLHR
eukprot:scaffold665779_cov45-Prasinocladus_malaysianus.AAC.1